jgi:predicted amidophosphoribosyltransferase
MPEERSLEASVRHLARSPLCPRCRAHKEEASALCRACTGMLPAQMRADLEQIESRPPDAVFRAIRAAANYFDLHFRSIRQIRHG